MEITTKYGRLSGVETGSGILYKGIPYAQPPVGALRWKAPLPPLPWEGVRVCDRDPFRCPQEPREPGGFSEREFGNSEIPCSEDSLYLNVRTPKDTSMWKLPVAVWIHGGAFNHGWCYEREYDGEGYAEAGVILVTINYRLGALGFLAHPLLSAENEHGVSGNYGILDQIAALKWVQENIAAFGGDPDNVTIFGQSAGAMSVLTLASSPLAEGLFAKAIMQSGMGLECDVTLRESEEDGAAFARLAGASTLEELRSLSVEQIMKASADLIDERFGPGCRLDFLPILDGYVLPDTYAAIQDSGRLRDIPYLLGATKNDIACDEGLGKIGRAVTDFAVRMSQKQENPIYTYYFTRQLPGDDAGAFHSSDLWYMFGSFHNCWRPMTEADRALSARMVTAWTDFMKIGTPGWPAATAEEANMEIFDIG